MSKLYGLIPAAGRGTRAYPYTQRTPKAMLRVNGVPNIERIIRIMRDDLDIDEVCIITGPHGELIRDYLGDGGRFGVRVSYVHNDATDLGLAYSILLGREMVDDYFCVMLSDECYIDTNHRELTASPYRDSMVTCGVLRMDDTRVIQRNYSVEVDGEWVVRLVEKPTQVTTNLLGLGTFVFHPGIFEVLETAYAEAEGGSVDLVTLLGQLCTRGERIRYFEVVGDYVNINDRDGLQLARYHARQRAMDEIEISLLIYSEGDEQDIRLTLREYAREQHINRIFVILPDDNEIENLVAETGATIIKCPPGIVHYGEKIKYAMERVPGDVLMLTEANYSFHRRDVSKLLAYLPEADMVIGTRTTRQLIEQGSNMRGIVRLGNVILAKFLEFLWLSRDCRFTDVGCTFRALWRTSFDDIRQNLVSRGPEFSAEMMIGLLEARERIIEIPVSYHSRSYSMYRKYQNVSTFWRMARLLVARRLRWLWSSRPFKS